MNIFGVKGPAVVTAIERLGCAVQVDDSSYQVAYMVTRDGVNTIATFDLCPDGAFRYGLVLGVECLDWHEFHIELQEAVK